MFLNMILNDYSPFRINPYVDIGQGETRLSCGLAISPIQAALCAREISRTAAFIKGLGRAIEFVQSDNPGRPVRILYAGCGPYALLAFPLMSVFSSDQVCFSLIDIHTESLIHAKALVESFGFLSHVSDFIHADASSYHIPYCEKPDIIISETMNACLAKEPQVMIMRNLYKQAPDAVIIPGSIMIDAYLLDLSKEFILVDAEHSGEIPEPDRDRIFLGRVFELNKANLKKWGNTERDSLPAAVIEIPNPLKQQYVPRLLTSINVFDDILLTNYDCSLTLPKGFPGKQKFCGGEIVQFQYVLGKV